MGGQATGGAMLLWSLALVWVVSREARGDSPYVFVPSNSLRVLSKAESANLTMRCSFPFAPPLNPTFFSPTPVFLEEPEDVTAFGDDHREIRLACIVKNAIQQVSWFFKQEGALSVWLALDESRSEASKDGNSLVFPAKTVLTPASAGYYRCAVSAGAVGSIVSRSAHLQLAQLGRIWTSSGPEFTTEDLTIVGVASGSSLNIPCDVTVTAWSAVNVSWQLNGKTLPLKEGQPVYSTADSPGYLLLRDGTLLLDNIPPKEVFDGCIFRCTVSSPTAKHLAQSKGLQVKISSQSVVSTASHAVHIVASNPNPAPGEQVTLACVGVNFTSASQNELKEKTTVKWFFKGEKMMPAMRSAQRSLDCNSLVTPGVSSRYSFLGGRAMVICGFENSGSYACEMSTLSVDGVVQKQASIDIQLKALPQRLPLNSQSSIELPAMAPHEHRVIDCSSYVRASSPATVQWLYNGKPVKTAIDSVSGAWLFTTNGSKHGMYQCVVSNQWGNTQVSFRVRMKSAPGRVRLLFVCDKTMKRKNYLCWKEPETYSSPITHYLIGTNPATAGIFRPPHTFIRLANTMPKNTEVIIEGCAGNFYKLTGCVYRVSACSVLGCGKTSCITVRAPRHPAGVGMSNRNVSAQSSSSLKLLAMASARDLFNKAIFLVRNKTSQLQTSKPVRTSAGPVTVELNINGLKSCTEYKACGQLSLTPELSFMKFFNSSRQDCNNEPSLWQTVKTLRSPAPEAAPSVLQVYRVSPTDAIIMWKPSPWCDIYPHTVFDVSYTSGVKSIVEKSQCVASSALARDSKTQVLVHQNLRSFVPYSLFARSCASTEECSRVLHQHELCSAQQHHAVNIPATLSWPVTIETHLLVNRTGSSTLAVNWAVSKDFHTLLPSARLLRKCSGITVTSSLILNVNMAVTNKMSTMLPTQVTNCSVWMEANLAGGKASTKVSDMKMVELPADFSPDDARFDPGAHFDVNNGGQEGAAPSKAAAVPLYVYIVVAAAGALLLLVIVAVAVRRRHRLPPVVDGSGSDEDIYVNSDADRSDGEEGPYDIPKASFLLPLAVRIAELRRNGQRH